MNQLLNNYLMATYVCYQMLLLKLLFYPMINLFFLCKQKLHFKMLNAEIIRSCLS